MLLLALACQTDCPEGFEAVDGNCYPLDSGSPNTDFVLQSTALPVCAAPSERSAQGPLERMDTDGMGEEFNISTVYSGYGMAIADLDGDGVLDIALPNKGADQLFLGVGDGSFVDASDRLSGSEGLSVSMTAVDVEGDGDLDLFVGRLDGPDELLVNEGGSFTPTTERAWLGSERTTLGSTWMDLDRDGDLDAMVYRLSNWTSAWHEAIPDEPTSWPDDLVYWNEGGPQASAALPSEVSAGFTFAAMFFDYDGAGSPGLYVANDYRGELAWVQPNRVFRFDEGAFVEVDDSSGANLTSETMGLAINDFNGDGRPDLLMSARGLVHLLMSAGDGWYDAASSLGLTFPAEWSDYNAWGVDAEDIDNDGDVDVLVGLGLLTADMPWEEQLTPDMLEGPGTFFYNPISQPDALFLQDDEGHFEDVSEAWGVDDVTVTRGVLFADFDNDGWLDIAKRDVGGELRIWRSRCGEGDALVVSLHGPEGNPFGVGAKLTLDTSEGPQTRWIHAGESLSSSAPYSAHFGLGQASVTTLTVRWPDGQVSEHAVDPHKRVVVQHEDALTARR
jgi:enediyne biosynthesis protein E4